MLNKESMVPRQKLPKVYMLNGMFYIAHVSDILKNSSFFNNFTLPFIINEKSSLNLDNKIDLMILNDAKKKNLIKDDYK